ncbi:hydroxyacid dehydrogenase [Sinomonas sp. G460-2]|uniref:hydroxyacid dehydrogenase n=1 Tax=Sinomonas sp. G460-2 TaxID=3393464 RepID=UPI0039F0026F
MRTIVAPARPRVAFSMRSAALRDRLFDPAARERLEAIADVVSDDVLTEFDSQAARMVLGRTTALITGWGCPYLGGEVLDVAKGLRLIAHAAGSVKGHVGEAAWDRGVIVTTAAQANAVPVAEYTLAAILLSGKDAFEERAQLRLGRSRYRRPGSGATNGNYGTTVGVIGASRVGRLVLERLKAFDFRVLLADPTLRPSDAVALGAELVPLEELLSESRIVSLHAPILPTTVGMIGATELSLMRDGATFINTARGVLVDHRALRAELRSGRLRAILDVTDPEPLADSDVLYELDNVVLTPHIAGSMGNELARMGDLAVAEVERLAAGMAPAYAISRETLAVMA